MIILPLFCRNKSRMGTIRVEEMVLSVAWGMRRTCASSASSILRLFLMGRLRSSLRHSMGMGADCFGNCFGNCFGGASSPADGDFCLRFLPCSAHALGHHPMLSLASRLDTALQLAPCSCLNHLCG